MELTGFEQNIIDEIFEELAGTKGSINFNTSRFIKSIRQIMPPTCTATEKAFLDEIRERGEQYSFYAGEHRYTYIEIGESVLNQKDFTVDLREFADEREDKES